MQCLREGTRQAHMRIEGALTLLSPRLSKAEYLRVLEAFYGFYAELEPRIAAEAGEHRDALKLEIRGKLALLALDLGGLGRRVDQIDALPRCTSVPEIRTASQALGALYVLEGATLGGQVIARSLQAVLGISATSGAAFFNGYGGETRPMWKSFCDYVDRAPGIETDMAVATAIDTFETLRVWLGAAGHS